MDIIKHLWLVARYLKGYEKRRDLRGEIKPENMSYISEGWPVHPFHLDGPLKTKKCYPSGKLT